jgi:hypothetical protein
MAQLLLKGSRGEEVRRLQKNLNAALGKRPVILDGQNIMPLNPDGDFGRRTKAAVEAFQTDYKLRKIDGKVGDETRNALATRVLLIQGTISKNNSVPAPPSVVTPVRLPPPVPTPVVPPTIVPPPPSKNWLFQVQPAFGLTPPPFIGSGNSVAQGQVAFGFVYRTAPEGPHWEFGGAFQPSVNSTSSSTDPRYSIQAQGSATFADPLAKGRFHTALFGQVLGIVNLSPGSLALGGQLGVQISMDIIDNKWNLYSQAGLQLLGQWDLGGSSPGQLQFGPVFTILGTTVQWDIK